jgi:dihydrofolate synthase/folylpolyglutamate synthase
LECGLGGAEDATNVIEQTLLAVFTPISRDHLGILGSTLEEIASVKAGIIKPGCTVVTAPQEPEVLQILKKQAGQFQCPLAAANRQDTELIEEAYDGQTVSYKDWKNLYCPLAGRYQLDNVITALEALRMLGTLGYPVSPDALRKGLSKTVWPGRLTCLTRNPLFLIDGAHNEAAAKKLRESLEAYFPGRRFIYIMGVFKDKEYEKIAGIMAPLARSVHTVSLPDTARTLPAEELAGVMKRYCAAEDPIPAQNCMGSAIQDTNVPVRAEASIEIAVKHAFAEANKTDIILAFGSLSYLGQVMRIHEDIRTQYINEI